MYMVWWAGGGCTSLSPWIRPCNCNGTVFYLVPSTGRGKWTLGGKLRTDPGIFLGGHTKFFAVLWDFSRGHANIYYNNNNSLES